MKVIKAIYNFLVGDMVILVGVLVTVLLLALLNSITNLPALKTISGGLLIVAVLLILLLTLTRETHGKR